jgi:hypothetical protein
LIPLAEDMLEAAFPVDKPFKHKVTICGEELSLKTDGLNNLRKVGLVTGKFFASAANEDRLMTRPDALQKEKELADQVKKKVGANLKEDASEKEYGAFVRNDNSLSQDLVDAYQEMHPEYRGKGLLIPHTGEHGSRLPNSNSDFANLLAWINEPVASAAEPAK